MTPEIQRALEVFELQSARQVWGNLTEAEKCLLCVLAETGEVYPPPHEVEVGPGQGGFYTTTVDGATKSVRTETPEYDRLFKSLDLVCWGQASGNWGINGGPGVYKLTPFGSVVARFGNALRIVELSAA